MQTILLKVNNKNNNTVVEKQKQKAIFEFTTSIALLVSYSGPFLLAEDHRGIRSCSERSVGSSLWPVQWCHNPIF